MTADRKAMSQMGTSVDSGPVPNGLNCFVFLLYILSGLRMRITEITMTYNINAMQNTRIRMRTRDLQKRGNRIYLEETREKKLSSIQREVYTNCY